VCILVLIVVHEERSLLIRSSHCFLMMQEVDPCEELSDEDIRIAIHNSTGPRNALFVPEVKLNWKLLLTKS
jgi:hypothetical protein